MPAHPRSVIRRSRSMDERRRVLRVQQGRQPDRRRADSRRPSGRFPARAAREGADARHPVRPQRRSSSARGPRPAPRLLASFIRINPGEEIATDPNATSELYYVIRGCGQTRRDGQTLSWCEGDIFTLPSGDRTVHHAERGRGLLLGPRRAAAPLPGRPGPRAAVPADSLSPGPGGRPSSRRSSDRPRRTRRTVSACSWPTSDSRRRGRSRMCSGRCSASCPRARSSPRTTTSRSPST